MAYQMRCAYLIACLALFFTVAAAHEGHDHNMPGMAGMAPSPEPGHDHNGNHGSLAYPSLMVGILALIFPFLGF
ncbi:hypothetical protein PanWU01x14_251050 [Parasponia andersonii]|uniref:Transmembrane protein n=1 Tax=Parasponia andersonii TaxID=3476 RepID=A0A2P5BCP9_PARAD|nr:hypothetical protein PanWU01x14_251050 [Parasponia andersonii]